MLRPLFRRWGFASAFVAVLLVACAAVSWLAIHQSTATSDFHNVLDSPAFYSPYNWYISGNRLCTNNPGAYLKARFTGKSFGLKVSTVELVKAGVPRSHYPRLIYSIDDGQLVDRQLRPGDTHLPLAKGLDAGTHTIEIIFAGVFWNSHDRWLVPVMALVVEGISIDQGATLQPPFTYPGRMLVYADSHGEGHEAIAATVNVSNQDASQAFPHLLGRAFKCEVGVVAYAGQGYVKSVDGANLPALTATWDHYFKQGSRLVDGRFSPAPDFILTALGTNDAQLPDDQVQDAVKQLLTAWQSAAPEAKILVAQPPGQHKAESIRSATQALANGRTFLLDYDENLLNGTRFKNGDHLSVRGHAIYATSLAWLLGQAESRSANSE